MKRVMILLAITTLLCISCMNKPKCNPYRENCTPPPPEASTLVTHQIQCRCTHDYRLCLCLGETYLRQRIPTLSPEKPVPVVEQVPDVVQQLSDEEQL